MTIEDAQLNELQNEARDLLASWPLEHPLFIEFAGTPKSGKSSCIDTVNHFFRRLDYKVLAPTEGASKRTPYYLKDDLVAFNAWSAAYALTHILEGYYGTDDYHLVIMDRGLFDALAWFELLLADGSIEEEACSAIQNFLLVSNWQGLIDMVFLFQADPPTSLERENRDKLIREPGRTMNTDFLQKLNDAYQTIREKYSKQFNLLYDVNTGDDGRKTTPKSTAFEVATQIVQRIKQRTG